MLPVPPRALQESEPARPEPASPRVGEVRFWIVFVVLVLAFAPLYAYEWSGVVSVAVMFAAALAVRFRKFLSPRRLPTRWQGRLAALLALALLGYGAWAYFHLPSREPPNTNDVRSVRVWAGPWNHEQGTTPDAGTNDPETIEALLTVVRSGQETREHKCGHCGVIVLKRSFGRVERLTYLPGHDLNYYEFRHGRKIYRVPRGEFVAAMKRLGVEVPLQP